MKNDITSEICQKCAGCCKGYPYVRLSRSEIHELEKLTGLPSDIFSDRKDKDGEEYFLTFKDNGDCFFLNEINGSYSCDVYESRSETCRNYPSKPRQREVCNSKQEMILLK